MEQSEASFEAASRRLRTRAREESLERSKRVENGLSRKSGTRSVAAILSCSSPSKQKVPLRHRQLVRRLAHEQLAVGGHVVGLGVDLDLRRRAVVDHALLADLAARVLDRNEA